MIPNNPLMEDKYVGTLLGLAIGDAFGMPLEFLTQKEIEKRYGVPTHFERPFHNHKQSCLQPGQYTDDTQLALLLAETIIERRAFDETLYKRKLLGAETELRGLGSTTRRAIQRIKKNRVETGEKSLGCGPLTRVIPIGLWYNLSQQEYLALITDSFDSARISHTHPEVMTGAALVAAQIAYLKLEKPEQFNPETFLHWSRALLDRIDKVFRPKEDYQSTQIQQMLEMVNANLGCSPAKVKKIIPNGGSTPEVLGVALYSFLHNLDFHKAIVTAGTFGGDADSHAALAGAYSGALNGKQGIPETLLQDVENREGIEQIALKLFKLRSTF